MLYPDARAARYTTRQHGLITRRQAVHISFSDYMIRNRVRTGIWRLMDTDVFGLASAVKTWRTRLLAVCFGTGGVACLQSAGELHGLDGIEAGRVDVLVPRGRRFLRPKAHIHETRSWEGLGRRLIDGIPVTGIGRTLVDLAVVLDPEALELTADSAVRRGLIDWPTLAHWTAAGTGQGQPGTANLRALLNRRGGTGASDSGGNIKLAQLIVAGGLPEPTLEYPVSDHDDRFVARLDLAWPSARLAVELDSVKYHLNRRSFENDPRRRNRLISLGWTVLVFTWADVRDHPQYVVQMVNAALEDKAAS